MRKITEQEYNKLLNDAIKIYPYGSRVYGTSNESSDYDFIVIVPDSCNDYALDNQVTKDQTQCTIYKESEFIGKLNNCDVDALECYFLPSHLSINMCGEYKFEPHIEIDREKVYRNFSQVASNSWVKCKKKLEVESDYYVGKKSLWHSLRILQFAKEILIFGKITEYDSEYHKMLYHEIVDNDYTDYSLFKEKYQPLYNRLKHLVKRAYFCPQYLIPTKSNCDKYNPKEEFCQECREERARIEKELKAFEPTEN